MGQTVVLQVPAMVRRFFTLAKSAIMQDLTRGSVIATDPRGLAQGTEDAALTQRPLRMPINTMEHGDITSWAGPL